MPSEVEISEICDIHLHASEVEISEIWDIHSHAFWGHNHGKGNKGVLTGYYKAMQCSSGN